MKLRKTRSKAKKRKTADPEIIHIRRRLVSIPEAKSHKDFNAPGLIRVLDRKDDKFPEFALYPKVRNTGKITKSLRDAGLRQEERGKWVLRTDRFTIFVYV